ncbi:hypothetical protein AB9C63_17900, partial [Escherichia coli]
MSDSNSRLVYSTETGRIDEPKAAPVRPKGDGVVRIQRQTSGRKGKGVCLITGVDLDDVETRMMSNYTLKRELAEFAASLVQPGETIFIENGS